MEFELEFDQYEFVVEVTDYFVQKPQGRWADNERDGWGYTDLEFEVRKVSEYNEDEELIEVVGEEKEEIVEQYYEDIYDKLIAVMEDLSQDVEDDYWAD